MIRLVPVKAPSMDDQDLLFPEKIQGEFLIIQDIKPFYVHFREDVECGLRLYAADPRDIQKLFVNKFPLFVDPSPGRI